MQGRIVWRALLLATAACAVTSEASAAAEAQSERPIDYDLPAQELGDTLRSIARLSGHDVMFAVETVRGRRAPAIRGRYSFDQALRSALSGSPLTIEYRAGAALIRQQTTAETDAGDDQAPAGSITVTGTRIRGVGSASPVHVTTRRELEQAGISDLADFTRILPENYTGGQNRGVAGGGDQGGQQNINNSATLNLRGLGPDATLTLLNGHRLSYDSINQGIDISAIPLSAIERVEVVADGASALYGSDAVAGVANIILRRDYQGLETTARIGGATEGGDSQQELSLVGGHRWATGGFMVALDASRATPIHAGQRDYARSVNPSLTLTDGTRQFSGVLNAHQQIGARLALEVESYFTDRRSVWQNPFYPETDVHVNGIVARPHVRSYAITPAIRADLGSWQAALSATDADSRTLVDSRPYFNGTARHLHLLYDDTLKGAEATAEGPLVALPGGDARLAVGGGLRSISLHQQYTLLTGGQSLVTKDVTERRNVQFAYGELSLPIAGPDLRIPLIDRLTVSAALRYEHWNEIASVTTPKLGLVYQPVPDVTLRATWGKSFKIPTLIQVNEIEEGDLIPGIDFVPAPEPAGSTVLLLAGSAPDLKPERATTWSLTGEFKPHLMPGLDLQATYFNVDYRGRIASPLPSPSTALFDPLFSDFIIYNPTADQVNAIVATLPGGLINETGAPFDPSGVGAIIDGAIRNTERQRIHGIDLNADYRFDLGPRGKLLLTGASSYLESNQQLSASQRAIPLAGTIFNPPHWRGRAGAVWEGQRTGLSAFVNYVGGRIDNRFPENQSIGAFVTLDLSASLRTGPRSGAPGDFEFRVSALNLLDAKPHQIRTVLPGEVPFDSTNESSVGRFLGVSVRKVW
jgi:outer membrane receptor protein involved in Fe transport